MALTCPPEQDLLAFHQGTLPEAALEVVAQHLETCTVCEAAAVRLESTTDPLLAIVRRRAAKSSWQGAPTGRSTDREQVPELSGADSWTAPPGYEIVCHLGRGGMGVVYKARQLKLNRFVALKRLSGSSERESARLRTEAEALGQLQHPGIVQIYEVGEHDGRIYLALELAEDGSLRDRLRGKPQAPRCAAEVVEVLARAVHYAHGHGIVHRDLKPANILLQRKIDESTRPLDENSRGHADSGFRVSDFTPKVGDFGIAKWLERDLGQTRDGEVIGTPAYMAPEQTSGTGEGIGPATDVYGLGVVLYELLTGRVPLQGPTTLDTLVMVRTEEPVSPRRLQPGIARDLETICLKCLAKDPRGRYASAQLLADDLRRFSDEKPVQARPTPIWERIGKWARRRPAVAALMATVLLVGALGVALVTWQWRRADTKAIEEAATRRQAERQSAGFSLEKGAGFCEAGDVGRGLLWLVRALELTDRADDPDLAIAVRRNLSGWWPYLVNKRADLAHANWVWAVAISPDGKTALTGSTDKTARLWDTATGSLRSQPLIHDHSVWAVTFSPDGNLALTGSGNPDQSVGESQIWSVATGERVGKPLPHPGVVNSVAFSPDGQTILTTTTSQGRLWRTQTGESIGSPLQHDVQASKDDRVFESVASAFSPDGQLVATGGMDRKVRFWESTSSALKGQPLQVHGVVTDLAFSPDGRTLAVGCVKGGAQLWDVATMSPRGDRIWPDGRVRCAGL